MTDFSAALPTFVITLREGVEAALVVGIVMAYLKKADRTTLYPYVYSGIAAGLFGSVLVGGLFVGLLQSLAQSNQTYAPIVKAFLEGGFSLIAVILLSWMLIWMTQQARSLKTNLESSVASVLQDADASSSAGWSVLGLIAIAVLREGFETVVFIAAQFQQGWLPAIGAIVGLIAAVGIGVLLFKLGVKINLRRFFQVMGVLLLLIVSGLVVTTLKHFDQALYLLTQIQPTLRSVCFSPEPSCILGFRVWDLSQTLPDRQFPGVLLKAFLGYRDHLYAVQAVFYGLFLAIVGSLYFRSITGGQLKTAHPEIDTETQSYSQKLEN